MKKPNMSIQLQTLSYAGQQPIDVADQTVFEIGAQISGKVNIQPLKQNPFSCEQVTLTVVGRIQGSKVYDQDFYQQIYELAKNYVYDVQSNSIPFTIVLELPASSYQNKKGSIEYFLTVKTYLKQQVFTETKIPIQYKKTSLLIKQMQAPLCFLVNKPNYQLYLQSDQSIYNQNDVIQGTIHLLSNQDLQDLELRLIKSEQFNSHKEQLVLASIMLCDTMKSTQEIPFCLPLGAFQLPQTISFGQIFVQTKLGFTYLIGDKKEEINVEIVLRE